MREKSEHHVSFTQCRRDPCPCVHDSSAKAKPKAKPKAGSSVAAAFDVAAGNLPSAKDLIPGVVKAVVSSFALCCPGILCSDNQTPALPMQFSEVPFKSFNANTGEVTWLGDTGAGRNIGGIGHVNPNIIGQSNRPVTFSTGGGQRDGSESCKVVAQMNATC